MTVNNTRLQMAVFRRTCCNEECWVMSGAPLARPAHVSMVCVTAGSAVALKMLVEIFSRAVGMIAAGGDVLSVLIMALIERGAMAEDLKV